MPSRKSYEAMLIALEVVDKYTVDSETAVLAAGLLSPSELAAGMVSLVRTLRRKIAADHGLTTEQVNAAIRRVTFTEMESRTD